MRQKRRFRRGHSFVGLALATLLIALVACVTERSAITGKKRAYGFSWNQEVQMGREADKQVIQEFGLYKDPKLQEYVQRIGEGVLVKSDFRDSDAPEMYRNTPFTFRVLDSPVVNAFAVPGGYIYVTRGLLTHLDNEAQLSVVLGHEIGHVAARHSARQALKAQVGQLGLLAGGILGGQVLGDAQAAQQLMGLGQQAMQVLMLKYSRDDEREADKLGVKYSALKGYDVAEGARFFDSLKRIGEKEGLRIPSWLSTHPDPGQREQTILQLAKQYEQPMAIKTKAEDEFLTQIENVVLGENPREGFVQNGTFYHPDLRFQFPVPRGWKLKNDKSAVLLADPNQRAIMAVELIAAKSAREAAQALANKQGVRVVQSQPIDSKGHGGYQIVGQANTQQGVAGFVNTFLEHNGRVYSLMGLTSPSALQTYNTQFSEVTRGFREVTDSRVLNVQPARVQVVTTDRSGPFTSFLPTSEAPGLTAEDLAILNQVQLHQNIPAGTKIKIPTTSSVGARQTRQTGQR
jgi:predicted Zn-dependent protease